MESSTVRYLFDTNAIRGLDYKSIQGKQSNNAALETTSDIGFELGERAAKKLSLLRVCKLDDSAYRKMAELVEKRECIRKVLDYYNNKGVGDVGVIAYALTIDEGKFIQDKTIIITDDKGVKEACDELSVAHVSTKAFLSS